MNAATAKKNSADWLKKAQQENKEYNRKRVDKEKRESAALWKTRGMEWVAKIDKWIEDASKQGEHGTYAPSSCNPDGDRIIWLSKPDLPIYQLLMEYYRDKGFTVEEYSPVAMKITW